MRCLVTFVILSSIVTSTGWAQVLLFPFEDKFDGPIDDDDPVSWVGATFTDFQGNEVQTMLEVTDGSLKLSNPAQLDPTPVTGFSLGLTFAMKGGGFILADSISAQTVVRVSDPLAFAGIFTAAQSNPPDGDGSAYFANIRGDGLITMGSFLGGQQTLPTDLNAVDQDVALQLDVIGNEVIASAWLADLSKPDSPFTVTFTDESARPLGTIGHSFGRGGDDPSGAFALFRSYQIVPEPSTVSLVAFAMLGLLGLRRRGPLG